MNINIEIEEMDIESHDESVGENNKSDKSDKSDKKFESFDDFFLQDYKDSVDNLLYVKKVDYMENYRVEDLKKIAKFYEIPAQRKKKENLVEDIVVYEDCLENLEKVQRRLLYWGYLEELKSDPYFKQFVIF